MNHILIAYSSRHGQTSKVAHYMCERLVADGFGVELLNIDQSSPDQTMDPQIDGIIVGAPVYMKQFPPKVFSWINRHRESLCHLRSAFFSVSLNAADKRNKARIADRELLKRFIRQSNWTPDFVAGIAGALNYTRYNYFLKYMMKWISRTNNGPTDTRFDHELTDWQAVDAFLDAFVKGLYRHDFATESLFSVRPLHTSQPMLSSQGGRP